MCRFCYYSQDIHSREILHLDPTIDIAHDYRMVLQVKEDKTGMEGKVSSIITS